jgi:TonB family protein
MMSRALVASIFAAGIFAATASTDIVRWDSQNTAVIARLMINAPRPEYPVAAQAQHITGYGVYDIWFRPETGVVTRIDIVRSTGSKLLDQAALRAFRQWRASGCSQSPETSSYVLNVIASTDHLTPMKGVKCGRRRCRDGASS